MRACCWRRGEPVVAVAERLGHENATLVFTNIRAPASRLRGADASRGGPRLACPRRAPGGGGCSVSCANVLASAVVDELQRDVQVGPLEERDHGLEDVTGLGGYP